MHQPVDDLLVPMPDGHTFFLARWGTSEKGDAAREAIMRFMLQLPDPKKPKPELRTVDPLDPHARAYYGIPERP